MLFKPQWLEIKEVYQGMHYVKKNFYASRTKMKRFFQTLLDTKSITSAIIMLVLNSSYEKAFFNSDIYQNYDMRELEKKFNFKN
jgi:hypothetical protein